MVVSIKRTPDECFSGLHDYPFEPHYLEIHDDDFGALRMHYVDEGQKEGDVILLLHGEPSWSYLYRHMIPPLAEKGFRVIAPDLIGFGKSDKLDSKAAYSYSRMVSWATQFIERSGIEQITLFCQDWGGLIGLRCVAARPDLFARLVISNTALPDGRDMGSAFLSWRRFAKWVPVFPVGTILDKGSVRALSDAERRAYDAPFPSGAFKRGARALPQLVPIGEEKAEASKNKQAWAILERFPGPVLTLFGDSDPVTSQWKDDFQNRLPGARGQAHKIIPNAGHFIQEDQPSALVDAIQHFVAENPLHVSSATE